MSRSRAARVFALVGVTMVVGTAACSRGADRSNAVDTTRHVPLPMQGAAPGAGCPPTGDWALCSVLYRLDRAGVAPRLDSGVVVTESPLAPKGVRLKIGLSASIELFFYPDSAARATDEAKLDRSKYVSPEAAQTINREKTLIESANLLGLLESINDHQRERVADAIMAGPPQPPRSK